jgi:hypothetical protein
MCRQPCEVWSDPSRKNVSHLAVVPWLLNHFYGKAGNKSIVLSFECIARVLCLAQRRIVAYPAARHAKSTKALRSNFLKHVMSAMAAKGSGFLLGGVQISRSAWTNCFGGTVGEVICLRRIRLITRAKCNRPTMYFRC